MLLSSSGSDSETIYTVSARMNKNITHTNNTIINKYQLWSRDENDQRVFG